MKTTITKRTLTSSEKSKMRKSHLFIIPMLLFFAIILYVIQVLGEVPVAASYAVFTIAVIAVLATLIKQIKLEKELIAGEVEVVNGVILAKKKTGKSKRKGIQHKSFSKSPDHIFMFTIDEKVYYVRPTDYSTFDIGDRVELIWFPKSRYVLSVEKN